MKKTKILVLGLLAVGAVCIMNSCSVKVPNDINVVKNFDIKSYAGQWYEIARFDFKHEKDLKNVTATYTLNDDGSIKVVNKGYNYVKNEWEQSEGKAKFNGNESEAALKVSFFGPFYGGYNVVAMEPDYENVLVFGENKDYIWILSRNKTIPQNVKDKFVAKAKEAGYDLNRLVWTEQD
ncbi:MAG: lipocalin family protein [Flavobacteriaceae bacterium]|nr:lipocalin family protein [Candidatus Onthonaster equi]